MAWKLICFFVRLQNATRVTNPAVSLQIWPRPHGFRATEMFCSLWRI